MYSVPYMIRFFVNNLLTYLFCDPFIKPREQTWDFN